MGKGDISKSRSTVAERLAGRLTALTETSPSFNSIALQRSSSAAPMTTDTAIVKTGRPPRLRPADEWELYCYRKSGIVIKTCASMFRVSVPTANRIIAKFRAYDERAAPLAREFREKLAALRSDAAALDVARFNRNDPRPPDAARALALLGEAQRLLDGLVERGEVEEGSCPDTARAYLDDAIGMLRPLEDEVSHG